MAQNGHLIKDNSSNNAQKPVYVNSNGTLTDGDVQNFGFATGDLKLTMVAQNTTYWTRQTSLETFGSSVYVYKRK